jgi:hypothetical protein
MRSVLEKLLLVSMIKCTIKFLRHHTCKCLLVSSLAVAIAPKVLAEGQAPEAVEEKNQVQAVAHEPQHLNDVRKIFVGPLGRVQGSDLIREMVINRLIKSGAVSAVDSPEAADAVLTGATEMSQRLSISGGYGWGVSGRTRYSADCAVRLVGRDSTILWTSEATSRRWFCGRSERSATGNLADRIVSSLLAAITADGNSLVQKAGR